LFRPFNADRIYMSDVVMRFMYIFTL